MRTYFSALVSDLFAARKTWRGASHSGEVTLGEYKSYARMPRIALPPPDPISMSLGDALAARRSATTTRGHTPMTHQQVSDLLGPALAQTHSFHRPYPSGGALFPIEVYLLGEVIAGDGPRAYHYVPTHALESLWDVPTDVLRRCMVETEVPETGFLIVCTSVFARSQRKYGDFAALLSILEAGHLAQNLLLVAAARRIKACPIAGVDHEAVAGILDLDVREQPFYAVYICNEP